MPVRPRASTEHRKLARSWAGMIVGRVKSLTLFRKGQRRYTSRKSQQALRDTHGQSAGISSRIENVGAQIDKGLIN